MSSLLSLSFASALNSSSLARVSVRYFADVAVTMRPVRGTGLSQLQRTALRAARKKQATKMLEQHKADASGAGRGGAKLVMSRYIWYLSVGLPTGLLVWGFSDENSPPAQFCRMIGLTDFIRTYTDEIAKPAHNKLLPDWSQVSELPYYYS
jgi:hypothetical protein